MKQISMFQNEIAEEQPLIEWDDEMGIKPGDIIGLGPHRLMCGDSTSESDMKALMETVQADMIVTDPPYNVNYRSKDSSHMTIENDNLEADVFTTFLTLAFKASNQVLKPGGAFYIFYANISTEKFFKACRLNEWKIHQVLVWLKSSAAMSRQDYNWIHEPIIYGWKPGASHVWRGPTNSTTVLYADRPNRSELHPTMKPVELYIRLIENNSDEGDVVLDMFGGSGTNLMACEMTHRTARVMEKDPHYCEMIVKRYNRYTNIKPIFIARGGV